VPVGAHGNRDAGTIEFHEIPQADAVPEGGGVDRELHDVRSLGKHGAHPVTGIRRKRLEVVMRENDLRAIVRGQPASIGLPFDVDVLGAEPDGLPDQREPLLFAALEVSAFHVARIVR
jgi:hypothetical protein